jgi:hypothetical protein
MIPTDSEKKMMALKMMALKMSELFFTALTQDIYPMEEIERVFGVVMTERNTFGDELSQAPLGTLVFGVWKTLYLRDKITQVSIADALTRGELPQFYERCVRGLGEEEQSYYTVELIERGFVDIEWDDVMHNSLKCVVISLKP